jgi:hypothetical protein
MSAPHEGGLEGLDHYLANIADSHLPDVHLDCDVEGVLFWLLRHVSIERK